MHEALAIREPNLLHKIGNSINTAVTVLHVVLIARIFGAPSAGFLASAAVVFICLYNSIYWKLYTIYKHTYAQYTGIVYKLR